MPVDIVVPPLSQTMDTLILVEWLKQPGEVVKKGEMLFSVETDKATLEVESPASGTISAVFAKPQSEIKVRSVIGKILLPDEDPQSAGEKLDQTEVSKQRESKIRRTPENIKQSVKPSSAADRIFSSPRARRLAEHHHIKINELSITGSGPRGMIVEKDVQAVVGQINFSSERADDCIEEIPQSNVRKIIAERMMYSHLNSAPVTYMCECDATYLVEYQKSLIKKNASVNYKPTFTDLFIKITCQLLQHHPLLNATFTDDQLKVYKSMHIALAVDTPRGLIVPVVKNAGQMNLMEISKNREQLVDRALSGKLHPDDLTGGTFTISNLGTLGIDFFTPIINPPQVAILAIGRIREVPAVYNGKIHIRQLMGVGVTCDHRVIDGAPAARFLRDFCNFIENTHQTEFNIF